MNLSTIGFPSENYQPFLHINGLCADQATPPTTKLRPAYIEMPLNLPERYAACPKVRWQSALTVSVIPLTSSGISQFVLIVAEAVVLNSFAPKEVSIAIAGS